MTTNLAGTYPDTGTTTTHYYDSLGRPHIDVAQIDGKWFYTTTNYDAYSRVQHVYHYWRPPGREDPRLQPYVWLDFGYTYTYDNKSYLLSLQDSNGSLWWETDASSGYDYLDRPVLVRKGHGHWTTRTYNPVDGTLTAISTDTIQDLGFTYDGLGNLVGRSNAQHGESFGYDSLNRLSSGPGAASYFANGDISSKTDVSGNASGTYGYDAAHPHAVASAFGYSMTYDANGDLLTRTKGAESWSVRWAGFDKPRWMAKLNGGTVAGSEFHYNADRSRTMRMDFDAMSGGHPSHYTLKRLYSLGSTVEIDYKNTAPVGSLDNWAFNGARIYVPGPDGVVGTMELNPKAAAGRQQVALVYHYDHLGSIDGITPYGDTSGAFATDGDGRASRYSYEPWGQRRDAATWSGPPATTAHGGTTDVTPRGFTSHEMLDGLGLVHMNGRMLSADLVVQNPASLQCYNRYSYVQNNPLTLVDPTGWYSILGLEFTDGGGVGGFFKDLGDYGGAVVMGAVGDNMVEGYHKGTEHMAVGMNEFANAKGGMDRTIGTLHIVAAVGAAVGVVMEVPPSGKAERLATEGAEKVAVKAEAAVTRAVEKAEAKAATVEKRIEGIAAGADSKVAAAAPAAEVAAAKQSTGSASAQLGKSLEAAGQARPDGAAAAHLVPTGNFSNRSEAVRTAISTAQEKFNRFLGSDARNGALNGFWSKDSTQMGTHTNKFFSALGDAFKNVASREDAEAALAALRKRIEDGEFLKKK